MAKKRKKDKAEEEKEYEFRPPEFDEKEFIKKELRDAKTVFLTVGYAAATGLLAAAIAIFEPDLVFVGLVLVLGGILSLRYFYPLVKVDIKEFTKKSWAANIAYFFFTFLAVWVLMFNYPFSDHANPDIEEITLWIHNSDTGNLTAVDYKYESSTASWRWVPRWSTTTDGLLRATDTYSVNITARISDNGRLDTVRIAVGSAPSGYVAMTDEGVHRYGYDVSGSSLSSTGLMFYIEAVDDAGNDYTFYPNAPFPVTA